MTPEEKTVAYDKALIRATQKWECGLMSREELEELFPELAESEDEKIVKELIAMVRLSCTNGNDVDKKIAWLEKQGQVNESIISQHENKICKENDNPLTNKDERIRKSLSAYFAKFKPDDMWDDDFSFGDIVAWLEKMGEQKPAEWSEEDEKIITEIINDIECAKAVNYHAPKENYEFRQNWLKSLRPQSTWKPKKNQMDSLEYYVKNVIDEDEYYADGINDLYNDLKKL